LICFNLTRVILSQCELGIEAEFWKDRPAPVAANGEEHLNVLQFPTCAGQSDSWPISPLKYTSLQRSEATMIVMPHFSDMIDSKTEKVEDTCSLWLRDLFHFCPGWYAMLRAYADESCTGIDETALCVAGVLFDEASAQSLDEAWRVELDKASVRYFHAKEHAHLQGEFANMDRQAADQLQRALIGLVVKHACGSAGVFCVNDPKFSPFHQKSWSFSPYTACGYACAELLLKIAKQELKQDRITLVIEAGHEKMGELGSLMQKRRKMDGWPCVDSWRFDEKQSRPLQAADILAYEFTKRIKDWDTRPVRKSARVLIPQGMDEKKSQVMFLDEHILCQIEKLVTTPAQ
jgi:hypothetical protein